MASPRCSSEIARTEPSEGRQTLEEPTQIVDLLVGDEGARLRIAQDSGLPGQMLLDLGPSERRIDRHRDAAGIQDAEEGREEVKS
jgi:hypothetical protein